MNKNENASETFIKHLQEEKLKTQEIRTKYVTQKLAYATALLGLGSLKFGSNDLSLLLYLVPFLAIVFDLYIFGEDYSVKRIGKFLDAVSTDVLERLWEEWVTKNRDPFAPFAAPLLTNVLATAAALVLLSQPSPPLAQLGIWLSVAVVLPWCLYVSNLLLRKYLNKQVDVLRENLKRTVENG